MMAFERRPDTDLDPATLVALRAALSRSLETGEHGTEISTLLRQVAAQARERGLHAEQLLIALKEVWYSLPEISVRSGTELQTQLLQQLIARCIQEYYSG
jgi:hypothetical protein